MAEFVTLPIEIHSQSHENAVKRDSGIKADAERAKNPQKFCKSAKYIYICSPKADVVEW